MCFYIEQNLDKISRWCSRVVMGLSVLGALAYAIFAGFQIWGIIHLAWWWKSLILLVAVPVLFFLVASIICISLVFIIFVLILTSCFFRIARKNKAVYKDCSEQPKQEDGDGKEEG